MRVLLGMALVGVVLFALVPAARAHDGVLGEIQLVLGQQYDDPMAHPDEAPWKGWLTISVKNIGPEPWGDFHIKFSGMGDLSTLKFLQGGMYNPTSSQSGLSWLINNNVVPATIDLYFYGDPVNPGQSAWFSVYTDNPGQLPFFGVCMWPTPIPEPASFLLLALGGLLMRRR